MLKNGFPLREHLKGKNEIDSLFENGQTIYAQCLKVKFSLYDRPDTLDDSVPLKMMVVVPKRLFKHAVKRNLLKRRVREAYRINKHDMTETMIKESKILHIAFLYSSNKELPYITIEKSVVKALDKIQKKIFH